MLIGRQSDQARLRALVHAAREGTSFALVLHGEAGVGKTALLDAAAQEAEEAGMRVLHSRADEGTTELPWAGLRALVAPLGELVDRLPEVQADVLRAALGTSGETSSTPDRFTVPVALLGLLGAAAEERPLLLVADDVQWIDAGSRDALIFVARRLAHDGVGLLLGARDGEGFDVEATRLPALRIEGLGRDDARALLGADVAPAVADVLGEAVGGNPLALTEVAAALSARQRRGDEPLPQPLPAGARIAELYARRIAELPPSTRTAVGVAALMRLDRTDLLSAALAELDLTSDELFAAERAGVLELERGAVAFRHPLVRAAAAAALSGEDRRAARRALAAVAPDERLRAWHLAGAATGPDAEVAAALDAAARDARGRGAPAEALQAWERAAALSPRPADAQRRWLEAARDALAAGDLPRLLAAVARLEDDPGGSDSALVSEGRRLAGVARMRRGQLAEGIAVLEAEADRLAGSDPAAAAQTLLLTTGGRLGIGNMPAVVDMARRVRALGGEAPRVAALADVAEGEGLVPQGFTEEGMALVDRGAPELDLDADDLTLVSMVGFTRIWTERYAGAREVLEDLVLQAREAGAISRLVFPLAARADLERRRGRWSEAIADAAEASRLGREAGLYAHMAYAQSVSARLAGAVGDFEAARRDGAESRQLTGAGSLSLHALGALGVTELAAGDPVAALEPLREAAARYRALGWCEPSLAGFHGDLLDALVAAGEREEAEEELARLAADAERSTVSWTRAVVARSRGLLAEDDGFAAHFAGALELHEVAPQPFERARTELLFAERLRRAGDRPAARDQLRSAVEAFEALGARPWAERARRELAFGSGSSGVQTATQPPPATVELTPQELRVALLVAQGLTNREAGAALFLSPKTIEHILTATYKKLGVRTRTQLAKRIAAEDSGVVARA